MRVFLPQSVSRSGSQPARQRRGWLPVFVIALLAGLLIFAPAALIGRALEIATSGRAALAESEGTLWHGRGRLLLAGSGKNWFDAGRLGWRLDKKALFLARLQWRLEQDLDGTPGRALLTLSPARLALSDAEIAVPARLLAGFSPAWAALDPRGTLRVSSPGFALQGGSAIGDLTVVWAPALFWGNIAAGDYQLQLHGRGGSLLEGEVTTLRGSIVVQGEGSVNPQGKLKGRAEIRQQPGPDSARAEPLFRTLCAGGRQACRFSFD